MKKAITFFLIIFVICFLILNLYFFYFFQKKEKEWEREKEFKKNGESKEVIECGKKEEKINKNPLVGPVDKKCCQGLAEWRASESFSFCLEPSSEGLIVDFPKENGKIKSPLRIRGQAKGFWFFEASFNAQLYDDNDNLLGTAILYATKDNWMSNDFVPFMGTLEFKKPSTSWGRLQFLSSNAAGIVEFQKIYEIRVQFDETSLEKILLYYYNPRKDQDELGNIKCSKDGLVAIEREISFTITPIQDTIFLLLRGTENLTQEEINQGITTEFPLDGFYLKSANLKEDGTLILEFGDSLNKTSGGACRARILWAQIEATAKQFPQVKKVQFLPEDLFQP